MKPRKSDNDAYLAYCKKNGGFSIAEEVNIIKNLIINFLDYLDIHDIYNFDILDQVLNKIRLIKKHGKQLKNIKESKNGK